MTLSEIANLPRVGPVVSSLDTVTSLVENAGKVQRDTLTYYAPSATSAAAWLIGLSDRNAGGTSVPNLQLPVDFPVNRLLGFRGQSAKYQTLTSTLMREKVPEKRAVHDEAAMLFVSAISAWHEQSFVYLNGRNNELVDFEAGLGVAQHYDLKTFFLDWTWDPLVALAFAITGANQGGVASVYIRDFGGCDDNPARNNNILLPPTFAKRVWRQRGFFSWHPVREEDWDSPAVRMLDGGMASFAGTTGNFYHVNFPVGSTDLSWAAPLKESLLIIANEPNLSGLAQWCANTAPRWRAAKWRPSRYSGVQSFMAACKAEDIPPPELLQNPQQHHEEVELVMDYLDHVAIRRHPEDGRLAYSIPHLLHAIVGMPMQSWPLRGQVDPRLKADKRTQIFFENDKLVTDSWFSSIAHLNRVAKSHPSVTMETDWLSRFYVDVPASQHS